MKKVIDVFHGSKELVRDFYTTRDTSDRHERLIYTSREFLDVHIGMDMATIDAMQVEHRVQDIWNVQDTPYEAPSTETILEFAYLECS